MHLRPAMVTAILWSLAVAIPLAMAGCVVALASGVEDGRSPARTIAIVSLPAALGLLSSRASGSAPGRRSWAAWPRRR